MIDKAHLENQLTPYAKAPVYYPDSLDPIFIKYMKKQHKKIEKSSNPIDSWLYLIEGNIRVIYTVLVQNNIPAIVKHGSLDWSNKGDFPPTLTLHWWIDVDPYRIDYRGRDWYSFNPSSKPIIEQVPYGVFIPSDFPLVSYKFERVEELPPLRFR
ncbi:MAG: hypothetical protein KME25_16030 [Symplocastrum torsivum CPER-KK1]|jgi:hypothetical protein|uniref:Uncharacterized protein n=1 Tax=Symplocastrum torsivum CPER-KK1 TaxID=450513 RepID=A0A951PML4_9CYAN|nr:hypothetical protein [Symplocastrum torsivum CPER-KK1]